MSGHKHHRLVLQCTQHGVRCSSTMPEPGQLHQHQRHLILLCLLLPYWIQRRLLSVRSSTLPGRHLLEQWHLHSDIADNSQMPVCPWLARSSLRNTGGLLRQCELSEQRCLSRIVAELQMRVSGRDLLWASLRDQVKCNCRSSGSGKIVCLHRDHRFEHHRMFHRDVGRAEVCIRG